MHVNNSRRSLNVRRCSWWRVGVDPRQSWPASWGYGAINSINGSGSSRPEVRGVSRLGGREERTTEITGTPGDPRATGSTLPQ